MPNIRCPQLISSRAKINHAMQSMKANRDPSTPEVKKKTLAIKAKTAVPHSKILSSVGKSTSTKFVYKMKNKKCATNNARYHGKYLSGNFHFLNVYRKTTGIRTGSISSKSTFDFGLEMELSGEIYFSKKANNSS